MTWLPIPNNPNWEYDNAPSDPGGLQSELWNAGSNGIRITQHGYLNYMNARLIGSSAESVPNEISKTFWDAQSAFILRGASGVYSLFDLNSTGQAIIRLRRTGATPETRDFTAIELIDGTLQSWGAAVNVYVVTWYDQSGLNQHATQNLTAKQPILVTAGTLVTAGNGLLAINFTGTQFLQTDDALVDITASINAGASIVMQKHNNATFYAFTEGDVEAPSYSSMFFLPGNNTTAAGPAWVNGTELTPTFAYTINTPHVIGFNKSDGGIGLGIKTFKGFLDGVSSGSNDVEITSITIPDRSVIGASADGAVGFEGLIQEVVTYQTPKDIESVQIEQVARYAV